MLRSLHCLAVALLVAGCGSASSDDPGGAGSAGAAGSPGSGGAFATAGSSGVAGSAVGGAGSAGAVGNAGSSGFVGGAGSAGSSGASGSAGGGLSGSTGSGGSGGASGSGGAGGSVGPGNYAGAGGFAGWPGGNAVVTVDPSGTYASDLSGLLYEPASGATPAVLWGVQNGPSKLYRLLWNGTSWVSDTAGGWSSGKTLRFADGKGQPDAEGVTKAAFGSTGLYTSIERDNASADVSRLSVLLFDGTDTATTINATREWNLTADQPAVGPNLGLEGIAWVPDAYLVSKGFLDESTHAAYDPAQYANHAGGLFFVGVEGSGMIYGYALDHVGGGFTRVATVVSGQAAVMELAFDREVGYLWSVCDDTCMGRIHVLDIDTRVGSVTRGKFVLRRGFERPSSMPNLNNEGFTMASEATCANGFKAVFYADDSSDNDHAIRRDSIPCGPFL